MRVGIEAIAFYGPEHYIELEDLARARGVEPAKYLKGLGQRRMAVATPWEDTVTFAVNAAALALGAFDVDPQEIGTLVVGTETGIDHSKPVAVYVHEALGLRENCRTFETKHACYGAMAGLSSACDWVISGRARGSKALVIAADIARYGLQTAGEPTQGAGAVAMVVSDRPQLLEIDPFLMGDYTKQVMDFWRPLYSKVAFVDGHFSIQCYLDALAGARADSLSRAERPQELALDQLAGCLYHVPFAKMAQKAHQKHWELEQGFSLERDDSRLAACRQSYQGLTAPWLTLNERVGNIYTGSLFLSLIDFLRRHQGGDQKWLGLFSYGSGCGAAFNWGRPGANLRRHQHALDPDPQLAARRRLTIDEYERIMQATEGADLSQETSWDSPSWNLQGSFRYAGTKDHVRQYEGLVGHPYWEQPTPRAVSELPPPTDPTRSTPATDSRPQQQGSRRGKR
jgi:hydroxymethylglutaryl-CoA synthase